MFAAGGPDSVAAAGAFPAIAIVDGFTTMPFSPIVTLTRMARGAWFVGWSRRRNRRDQAKISAASAPPPRLWLSREHLAVNLAEGEGDNFA